MMGTYESPKPIPEEEAQAALVSDDVVRICDALLRLSLFSSDWRSVQGQCLRFLEHPVADVERDFLRHLECGVLARGFSRVRCQACGDELLVAFSCKRRGERVLPSMPLPVAPARGPPQPSFADLCA